MIKSVGLSGFFSLEKHIKIWNSFDDCITWLIHRGNVTKRHLLRCWTRSKLYESWFLQCVLLLSSTLLIFSCLFFPSFISDCVCERASTLTSANEFSKEWSRRKAKKQTTTINSISVFSRLFHDDGNFLVVAFELLYLFLYPCVCVGCFACAWTFPFLSVNMWITCVSVWLIKILYAFAIFHQENGLSGTHSQFYFPFFSSLQFDYRTFSLLLICRSEGKWWDGNKTVRLTIGTKVYFSYVLI